MTQQLWPALVAATLLLAGCGGSPTALGAGTGPATMRAAGFGLDMKEVRQEIVDAIEDGESAVRLEVEDIKVRATDRRNLFRFVAKVRKFDDVPHHVRWSGSFDVVEQELDAEEESWEGWN